jgi:hypothetical protein
MVYNIINKGNNKITFRQGAADQLKTIRSLADIHENDNMDATFLYDFEGVDVDMQIDIREHQNLRRNRKRPSSIGS